VPVAAIAAIVSLIWPPLGEMIAAPAVLAATALIRTIDVLGAPEAYVSVGLPPLPATAAIAATAAVLLLLIAGTALRQVHPIQREVATGARASTRTHTVQSEPVEDSVEPEADPQPLPIAGDLEPLPSSAFLVTGEDPLDALATDPDDAIDDPAGQEVGHDLADERQVR
jgi:hypothetical protein